MEDKPIMATITGEFFQPVRLHYQVFDPKGLQSTFKRLRCIDHDPTQDRWVWLYEHEARDLRFKRSYKEIPRQQRPIVLGSLFSRQADELLIDLRSHERAIAAIRFFDRRLPRSLARVTEADVVNRLFDAIENAKLMPHDLFDHRESISVDSDSVMKRIEQLVANVADPQEKLRIADEEMRTDSKRARPEIERMPVHFYEDGMIGFENALRFRQLVAMKHWMGDTEYSMYDAIQETVGKM